MKWGRISGATCVGLLVASGSVLAQEVDPELTIDVIADPADLPTIVMQSIVLPPSAAAQALLNSEAGLTTANDNRAQAAARREEALLRAEQSRQAGLDTAAEARARGVEAAEAAQENRENLGRGDVGLDLTVPDHLPQLPAQVPADLPELPDLSTLPERPVTPGPPSS